MWSCPKGDFEIRVFTRPLLNPDLGSYPAMQTKTAYVQKSDSVRLTLNRRYIRNVSLNLKAELFHILRREALETTKRSTFIEVLAIQLLD